VLRDLAHARRRVLAHVRVHVVEAREDLGKDFRLDDDLREVDAVLGDLCEAGTHLALQLAVVVLDQRHEVRHRASIHDGLRELQTQNTEHRIRNTNTEHGT
jgi:hypothetical protein